MKLRSEYKDAFAEKHGVKLGLMSGFIKVPFSKLFLVSVNFWSSFLLHFLFPVFRLLLVDSKASQLLMQLSMGRISFTETI